MAEGAGSVVALGAIDPEPEAEVGVDMVVSVEWRGGPG